jgi:hypothetical protein
MSILLALAAAASLTAAPPPKAAPHPPRIRAGVADVSGFARRDAAMVTPVKAAPCRTDNHTKWPEAGCLAATQRVRGG